MRNAKNIDLRNQPAYTLAEGAHYLEVASATLRSWVVGRPYPKADGVGLRANRGLNQSFLNFK